MFDTFYNIYMYIINLYYIIYINYVITLYYFFSLFLKHFPSSSSVGCGLIYLILINFFVYYQTKEE